MLKASNTGLENVDILSLGNDPTLMSPIFPLPTSSESPGEQDSYENTNVCSKSYRSGTSYTHSVPTSSSPGFTRSQTPGSQTFGKNSREMSPMQYDKQRSRSFACDSCSAHYPHAKSLRDHKQSKHQGKRYACNIAGCETVVAHKKNLRRHKENQHGISQSQPLGDAPKINSISLKRSLSLVGVPEFLALKR
ncbi:hypothetical protein M3J09_008661 [Ascochyta lentis]